MYRTKRLCILASVSNTSRGISESGISNSKQKYEIVEAHCLQPCRRYVSEALSSWRFKSLPSGTEGGYYWSRNGVTKPSRQFGSKAEDDNCLPRSFLAQLWVADRKMKKAMEKKKRTIPKNRNLVDNHHPSERYFSGAAANQELHGERELGTEQPPISQSADGLLNPDSPGEVKIYPLLARSNLLITRNIEWANLVLGFEQENRYGIVDVCYPESPVGLIREKSSFFSRQLLRLRRPFVASITDAQCNELFKVRRPFWWINSSIYAEIDGKEIGVVHKRWHLWKRNYDLYLGNKQFAEVRNPGFWNWTFTLKDIDGKVLAEIDRDWRGFGFELFTDAGKYVIRFGAADSRSKTGLAEQVQELDVVRPLNLSERAVTLALAISLDNDYFSRHGGWSGDDNNMSSSHGAGITHGSKGEDDSIDENKEEDYRLFKPEDDSVDESKLEDNNSIDVSKLEDDSLDEIMSASSGEEIIDESKQEDDIIDKSQLEDDSIKLEDDSFDDSVREDDSIKLENDSFNESVREDHSLSGSGGDFDFFDD